MNPGQFTGHVGVDGEQAWGAWMPMAWVTAAPQSPPWAT